MSYPHARAPSVPTPLRRQMIERERERERDPAGTYVLKLLTGTDGREGRQFGKRSMCVLRMTWEAESNNLVRVRCAKRSRMHECTLPRGRRYFVGCKTPGRLVNYASATPS